jgi:CheY-like chemotaxis protein
MKNAVKESAQEPRVLIVEDDEGLASIIQAMLESEGYKVTITSDGQRGYVMYLLFRPDLIITDIQMPVQNGLDFMKHVRKHSPEVRAIYMSGAMDQFSPLLEEEKKRHDIGLLLKPFTRMQLLESVLDQLGDK